MDEIKILCRCGKEFMNYNAIGLTVKCPYCKWQQPNPLKLVEYRNRLSEINRKKYLKSKVKILEKNKIRIDRLRDKWYNHKPCIKCGVVDGVNMTYHHIDSTKKSFEIARAIASPNKYSDEVIEAEIKKCIILCRACHRSLHMTARNLKRSVKDQYIIEVGKWTKQLLKVI